MIFYNKKIFILGMARSGFSAAKLLAEHNNKIFITDMKEQNQEDINERLPCRKRIRIIQTMPYKIKYIGRKAK